MLSLLDGCPLTLLAPDEDPDAEQSGVCDGSAMLAAQHCVSRGHVEAHALVWGGVVLGQRAAKIRRHTRSAFGRPVSCGGCSTLGPIQHPVHSQLAVVRVCDHSFTPTTPAHSHPPPVLLPRFIDSPPATARGGQGAHGCSAAMRWALRRWSIRPRWPSCWARLRSSGVVGAAAAWCPGIESV